MAKSIKDTVNSGGHAKTTLSTDERVLARITDGIYRQPASALRELIFNAYDADAEHVWIQTDAPRFSQITVNDDGMGMTIDVLEHLVKHIGGSPKRTQIGVQLGVTDRENPRTSPGGRKLIGKIGIGLFSVAQLTRHFQVITKPANEPYRYVADVRLKTYSEDQLENVDANVNTTFETGDVEIWREKASDRSAHGTQVILLDLKDYSRSLLQSRERWSLLNADESLAPEIMPTPPAYHIGAVDPLKPDIRQSESNLPWDAKKDKPSDRFRKLYDGVLSQIEERSSDPTVDETLDNYLAMIWNLALASPIDYIDQHPFDIKGKDGVRVFLLSNRDREPARELDLKPNETVRKAAGLTAKPRGAPFSVDVDGVQLFRPIRFRNLPTNKRTRFTTPLLFVAKCHPDLSGFPSDATGGRDLEFEGYFFWAPKVVPKENNGLILRIGNSSGTLFDDTFMKYEVSEQTRLRQITAELFVTEGLDAALNIDRESYNFSHPHFQFLSKWVHRALRQIATRHKALGKELSEAAKKEDARQAQKALRKIVLAALRHSPTAGDVDPPEVYFVEDVQMPEARQYRKDGALVFQTSIFDEIGMSGAKKSYHEDQLKAAAQILDGFGLFDRLKYDYQHQLLLAFGRVFISGGVS